jgi:hypothetical protein
MNKGKVVTNIVNYGPEKKSDKKIVVAGDSSQPHTVTQKFDESTPLLTRLSLERAANPTGR